MASPYIATASDLKLALVEARTDRLESRFRDAESRESERDCAISDLRSATVELRTTLRIASAAAIVGTPLLAAFGAWLVIRALAPLPSSSPAAAMPAFQTSAAVSAKP